MAGGEVASIILTGPLAFLRGHYASLEHSAAKQSEYVQYLGALSRNTARASSFAAACATSLVARRAASLRSM